MAQNLPPGIALAGASWYEVGSRLRRGATAILPVGAGAKQHGLHLPMATDQLQADWLADRLIETRDVVVWPTLNYGFYPAFVDYPGSISLYRETFVALFAEIMQGITHAGAQRIAIINTGISTIDPIAEVIARASMQPSIKLINVYSGPRFAEVESVIAEQHQGGHADELETSIMLVIAPQLVEIERARANPIRIEHGPFNRTDRKARNYSPTGVNGDPTLANRGKGKRLTEAMLEDILDALDGV